MNKPDLPAETDARAAEDGRGPASLSVHVSLAASLTAIAALYAGVILTYSRFADHGQMIGAAAFLSYAAALLALVTALLVWLRHGWAKVIAGVVAGLTGVAFVASAVSLVVWAVAADKNPIVLAGPIGAAFGFAGVTLGLAIVADGRRAAA